MCEFCKYLKYRLYYTLFQIILLQNFLLLCYSLHFALIDTAHFDPTLFALINLVNTLFEWTIWIFNFGRSIMEFQNSHLRKRKSDFAKNKILNGHGLMGTLTILFKSIFYKAFYNFSPIFYAGKIRQIECRSIAISKNVSKVHWFFEVHKRSSIFHICIRG